jgi:hypothetical protein
MHTSPPMNRITNDPYDDCWWELWNGCQAPARRRFQAALQLDDTRPRNFCHAQQRRDLFKRHGWLFADSFTNSFYILGQACRIQCVHDNDGVKHGGWRWGRRRRRWRTFNCTHATLVPELPASEYNRTNFCKMNHQVLKESARKW